MSFEKISKYILVLGLCLLLVVAYIFSVGEDLFIINSGIKSDKIGQFGDIIGGVIGSLWTLASILLFYSALKEQRKSLEKQTEAIDVQRQELEDNRKELKRSADAQRDSQIALRLQLEQMEIANDVQRQELEHYRNELKQNDNAQRENQIALQLQLEQMKIATRLQILDSLLTFYNSEYDHRLQNNEDQRGIEQVDNKRRSIIKEIDVIKNKILADGDKY